MAMTKVALAASLVGAATAHWGHHGHHQFEEKFQPLIDACEGRNSMTNCSATFDGVCQTRHAGERVCDKHHTDDHEHHGHHVAHKVVHFFKGAAKSLGFKCHHDEDGEKHGHHHHHESFIGDCGAKQDGEACSVKRPGRCLATGKCPIFKGKGETVCKPWDMHAPKFITKPCEGKQEGETCEKFKMVSGTCKKLNSEDALICKGEHSWKQIFFGDDKDDAKAEKAAAPAEQGELMV